WNLHAARGQPAGVRARLLVRVDRGVRRVPRALGDLRALEREAAARAAARAVRRAGAPSLAPRQRRADPPQLREPRAVARRHLRQVSLRGWRGALRARPLRSVAERVLVPARASVRADVSVARHALGTRTSKCLISLISR